MRIPLFRPHHDTGRPPGAPDSRNFGVALKPRVALITLYALLVGGIAGLVSEGVLELIFFFTHLFFSGHVSRAVAYPDQFRFAPWIIFIPAIGGLVAGLAIHFLEPSLKGHGTPEAMEAVLISHSVMRKRVGVLKPIISALAIGTGGPFGAEGPIIQTGGAFGSVLGKTLMLSPYETRVLLGAGAAAGLSGTFIAPFSGVLMAIELLLFEFSARSFIPVGLASAVATVVAICFRGSGPLFRSPHWALAHLGELWLFALMGLLIGMIAVALIRTLYWVEDLFDRFPLKPSAIWAPVVGSLILGCIGYFVPQVFGTSYDTIGAMLKNALVPSRLLEISAAKFCALVIALGSGTTGGVFAPSLVIGGGVGSAFAAFWHHFLPHLVGDPSSYSLVAMGALFAGSARVPLTSVVFMLELSRNPHALLPLIVCCFIADLFVRIFNTDSIMTGKLHKRGLLILQDYSAPVLVGSMIQDVVRPQRPVPADMGIDIAASRFSSEPEEVLPVASADGSLLGIIEAHDLLHEQAGRQLLVRDVTRGDYVVAHRRDLVDSVARNMLSHHVDNAVLVDEHGGSAKPIGVIRAADLLKLIRRLRQKHLLTPVARTTQPDPQR
jgi:chloride channel protein, CIC family